MKRLYLFLILLLAGLAARAQQSRISSIASLPTIADSLKKDANAVYRLDEGRVEITSPSEYTYRIHQVITLLNKNAARHLDMVFFIDKFTKMEDVQATLFNNFGLPVKTFKKSDFKLKNYDDNMSVFTDGKLMYLDAIAPSYPCTIEISYVKKVSGYINLPSWVIANAGEAVQRSQFVVTVPAALDIRHKTTGTDVVPLVANDGVTKKYTWELANIKAPPHNESGGYRGAHTSPLIRIAPNRFNYDGYPGEMTSWKTFGDWSYALYNEFKHLDPAAEQGIRNIVAGATTDVQKTTLLYNHLKKNMRYVSIQLGIGGFRPFPVAYVHQKQYGDCKALTNYMRYMLQVAGIASYPALISAGSTQAEIDTSFAMQYFNHVILCVPLASDTMWLECTSNTNDAGVLGNFTEDRTALLLTPQGGKLVRTPGSTALGNQLTTFSTIEVKSDGSAVANVHITSTGEFKEMMTAIAAQSTEEQKRVVTEFLKFKIPDDMKLGGGKDTLNAAVHHLLLAYEKGFEFKAGNKYFFRPKMQATCNEKLVAGSRTQPYLFDFAYTKSDTTLFILPQQMQHGNLPAPITIGNASVQFTCTITQPVANQVKVVSTFSVKNKVVAPEDYTQVAEIIDAIRRREEEKLVFSL